ncbi:TetR family transcriptional regulator [Pseudomonas sp. M47T1]|uniref:TetR/AcrR family transcriptional regulator n=1 Tax=Pseudomonas sp. M47T1 TaxID=1179778 RepID=UPI00026075CC|nr:TetR/AcrR family transcriptional regulator [Pseudomonas sp. M47T1]EIK95776.1 TetR family transcriptional regulator [Pseudomonas sp. M47T1]
MNETTPKRGAGVQQRVVDSAGSCVERLGLEATTVDDIATEAGVSRATLYRKFANKEAIFDAMVAADAEPFAEQAEQILKGAGDLATRIEDALALGILAMAERRWLHDAMQGAGSLGNTLFQTGYRQRSRAVLALILQSPQARPGLELDPLLEWFMRELLALVAARPWDEVRLRRHIADFVLPVLILDQYR